MKLFILNDDVNSFEHVIRCIQKYLNYCVQLINRKGFNARENSKEQNADNNKANRGLFVTIK